MMKIPGATYRLQFHRQFTLDDARTIVEYLSSLGISDIYASPVLKSKSNSTHGYDVVDPNQINPGIGGIDAYNRLLETVEKNNMGWLQDIVPNHMAFDSKNRPLMDILENGPVSKYYTYFDIQWEHPYDHLKDKLLAPFLGDLYGKCLERNEIKLEFDENGFCIRYYEWRLPLKIGSYTQVLASDLNWLEGKIHPEERDYLVFLQLSNNFRHLSELMDTSEHYNQLALMKARLWKLYVSNPVIKGYIDHLVTEFNGRVGDPHSFNKLDALLSQQYFKFSYWKVGNEELNYRRFFTINGLLSVRVEDLEVFEYTHHLIFQLVNAGRITGLRIDHIDGLYDPIAYLNKLRQRGPQLYITIEKILDINEQLPSVMPVQGTTGYDFMNIVNGVFIDRTHEKMIDDIYRKFTGQNTSYHDLVTDKKKLFMGQQMAGDIDNLAHLLKQIIDGDRYGRDMTMYALRRSIVEIMAQFPVYRAYMGEEKLSEEDKIHIKEAIASAQNKNPGLTNELGFIAKILLLEFAPDIDAKKKEAYYNFTRKFQQYSGALMAKAAEDTTFYIYNRFISLNEVGGKPSVFGTTLREFHDFMIERQRRWPYTMNATSTHDTKRGEDVRARLNVLSEMPKQWQHQTVVWSRLNKRKKKTINGQLVPDKNEEYFIYQTLLGAWPLEDAPQKAFAQRMKEYMLKALREAKIHTTWLKQDSQYEQACMDFIEDLLKQEGENRFLNSFLDFQKEIAGEGAVNSLSQVLLKLTCPGVPDFYQGTEFWDLALVDPDNRRPVDYNQRMDFLRCRENRDAGCLQELWQHWQDGRIKLWLIAKVLEVRNKFPDLFLKGEYIPIELQGKLSRHAIIFVRRFGQTCCLTAVPRFLRRFRQEERQWREAWLALPPQMPGRWTNVLTGSAVSVPIRLEALFHEFPVVFLSSAG